MQNKYVHSLQCSMWENVERRIMDLLLYVMYQSTIWYCIFITPINYVYITLKICSIYKFGTSCILSHIENSSFFIINRSCYCWFSDVHLDIRYILYINKRIYVASLLLLVMHTIEKFWTIVFVVCILILLLLLFM